MSDETTRQIQYLIEITQQDFQLKASLLSDVVEGEVLVAEILQDIKLDVASIKDSLFNFFEEEKQRFQLQQTQSKEQNFRTIEALKEATSRPLDSEDSVREGRTVGENAIDASRALAERDGGGGLGFLGALGAVAGIRLLLGALSRFAPIAAILGTGAFAIDMLAESLKNLQELEAQGFDPDTATKEAISQAFAETMADAYDVAVAPALSVALNALGDELGYTSQEVNELEKSIKGFRSSVRDTMLFVADQTIRDFGEETAQSSRRLAEREIEDIQQDLKDAKIRQERLDEIEQERQASLETGGLPIETTIERQALLMQETPEEAQARLTEAQQSLELSQAGFRAGDLQTEGQLLFAEGIPSDKKEEFIKDNVRPKILSAIDSGALSRDYFQTFVNSVAIEGPGPIWSGLLNEGVVPVEIADLNKLKNLSPAELEAILINDDVLKRSKLQVGALNTSDRKIVEMIYRMKTLGVDNQLESPDPTDGPLRLDSASDDFLPSGDELRTPSAIESTSEEPRLNRGSVSATPLETSDDFLAPTSPIETTSDDFLAPTSPIEPTIDNAFDEVFKQLGENDIMNTFNQIFASPALTAAIPVNEMSKNITAQTSMPIVITTNQGGSNVTNQFNNSSTTMLAGGIPARSSDVAHRRQEDRMQYLT